ncbi:MAG: methyltransferase domain-containing protein [Elusimicrobia bacterium]|nr:methyltransferase domain-containing protein [Elusimicrobiota bacterium]
MTGRLPSTGKVWLPCPVCAGRGFEPCRTLPNLDPNVDAEVPEIAVSVCRGCGLICQNPCVPRARMERLYARLEDKVTAGRSESVTEAEGLGRLEAVLRLHPPPARLLEAGCSDGAFLRLAEDAGYRVVGVEPSRASCAKARSLHPGLDVRCGFFDDFKDEAGFDVVCHFFVLEHVYDPKGFLTRTRGLLRAGGAALFELPDVESYARLPFANSYFTYQHLWHFSRSSINDFLGKCRFGPIRLAGRSAWSSRPYGMRVAARPSGASRSGRTEDGREESARARSVRLLNAYFARREDALEAVAGRVRAWLPRVRRRPGPVVIFGAGENGRILLAAGLAKTGRDVFFCDNGRDLQGTSVDGVPVFSPDGVPGLKPSLVIAASSDYEDDIVRQLLGLGINRSRIARLYGC